MSGLLLRGVNGKRAGRSEPFIFGAIRAEFDELFFVNRDPIARQFEERFWVAGKVAADVSEPFGVDGPLSMGVEEPFNFGGVVLYDEGGVASPALGHWTDRDTDLNAGTR